MPAAQSDLELQNIQFPLDRLYNINIGKAENKKDNCTNIFDLKGSVLMGKYFPPSASDVPRYSGIKTFMRLPYVKTTEDIDFAIVGIPFDTACNFKVGARLGPSSIREASALMKNYNMNLEVNIFDYLSGVDYGDVPVVPSAITTTYDNIVKELTPLLDNNVMPMVMGGDHSITLGELRAVAKKYGPVALMHFDSHSDTSDIVYGQKYNHGTPFRRAMEDGLLDPGHCIQVGIRGTQYGPEDLQGARDLGIEIITANELHIMGVEKAGEIMRKRLGGKPVFLTFDIDFCDPSCAPGTGTIEPGGFTSYEALSLIRELKDENIVAMDLVEVLPTIDPSGQTAFLASVIMNEVLAIKALQKKNGNASV